MNREIKFEIKLIAKEEMNGYKKGETVIIVNPIFDINIGIAFWPINKNFDVVYKRQYTGLKDKNGKEIYEGDIISSKPKESKWNPLICKIAFNQITAKFEAQQYWPNQNDFISLSNNHDYYEYEIIGNIYENPELLK